MAGKILICDDDAQIRGLIATVLRRGDYDLRQAAHGQEALDELANGHPDLVILDVQMPGIDGLEVLERIRGDAKLTATKVLLLSGAKEALEKDWGTRVGADAHLRKPFAVAELDGAVRALLAPD